MKTWILALALAVVALNAPVAKTGAESGSLRQRTSLDAGWRFAFGNAADPKLDFGFGTGETWAKVTSGPGPVRARFDDSSWREIDLPHDWVPALPFTEQPRTAELVSHGFKPVGRAFPGNSIGWYRKRFTVPATEEGRRFSIEFDGVYRDCYVWLNGVLLGRHEGGYDPFAFDASDLIRTGENLLTVRVDATQAEGWFYEGAGIYRHVRLVSTAPVHVPQWGVYVTSQPVQAGGAGVQVATEVQNDSDNAEDVVLESRILDPNGSTVATLTSPAARVEAWKRVPIRQSTSLAKATPWSLERPALYRLVTTLRVGSEAVDSLVTSFGIRSIRFDPDKGFFLNGQRVQIDGTCNHQDHAGVGSAVPDGLQRYRLLRLKEMGVNAYRTSHNPPASELLNACDELGILVMDETRLFSSSGISLDHLRAMVARDRNHPSVILWSIGNEEPEQATERGNRIARTMIRNVKALDDTRPVTYASNRGPYQGVNELMDVRGFNYYIGEIDRYHKEHPGQPLLGSEIASTLCTRGEYAVDKSKGYVPAYDKEKPRWGELAEEWMRFFGERPWLAGAFVWTGFDYRGEPTPYEWPCINSHFGILDTCGFPKDLFWYYKSWWTNEPVLHLLPHWNWQGREGQPIEVWAFTNAQQVRLWLNGRDLGSREVERFGHAEWQVPYEPGRLEAVGYRDGREVSRAVVETTGPPARLVLEADRPEVAADRNDVSVVRVSVVDERGREVPTAGDEVTFELNGPGRIIGVGNGDPSSHEADQFLDAATQPHRRLFNGLAQVIVQPTGAPGELVLRASAQGVTGASLTVVARPAAR
jgi:beta-galactosidase